jgi:GNAT superfamily N-acetyltransferase
VGITVEAAGASTWPDVVAAFGPRSSNPDSCWCQRFRRHNASSNRDALQRELHTGAVPVGLLAYVDDQPAGWTRVVPRHTLPGVSDNRALQRILDGHDDGGAWWVTCFAIRREYRGQGVGAALLNGAVDHARNNSGSVLDGHPVDLDRLKGSPSPSALFTGTLSMFQAAGFREIGRTYPSRPVMRKDLSASAP